jgi:FixJ family two-component response regulator
MDAHGGSLAGLSGLGPSPAPSVLIIEPQPTFAKILTREAQQAMPDIVFDVRTSREHGLSALRQGQYHTVITDARVVEPDHYSILKEALSLPCPVPVLISATAGDLAVVVRALGEGALDVIPCPPRATQALPAIRSALSLYQLRLIMRERRQRLQALFDRRKKRSVPLLSHGASALLDQTIRDIQQTDKVFDRTIQQIEMSVRVLEDSSRRIESERRAYAMRMVRLLSPPPQTGLNDRCVRKRALHVPQYRNVLIERSPTVL